MSLIIYKKKDYNKRRKVRIAYKTDRGRLYQTKAEDFFSSSKVKVLYGKVQLIFTSPPFILNRKKKYGNLTGEEYITWFAKFAHDFKKLLKKDGSIVIELGNGWEPGKPTMSTLALQALLKFLEEGKFHLCQQFICYNPARLPSPAQWVNVERIRVKDAFTHVWWISPNDRPKANNRRILKEYSKSMKHLLATGKYNSGKRPSEHHIGKESFNKDNKGAIPPNVLTLSNTKANDNYLAYCRINRFQPHPARMQNGLAEFFIKFLTTPRNLVFDPFGGSNTTGAMAEKLKRRWVSLEPVDDYVYSSVGRFKSS